MGQKLKTKILQNVNNNPIFIFKTYKMHTDIYNMFILAIMLVYIQVLLKKKLRKEIKRNLKIL